MRMNSRIFVLAVAVICIIIAGCKENDGSGYIFKCDIPVNPRTLDPQTATGQTAALLISNMYDGLLKVESDGNVAAGVAAEYIVSDDKLTYTFFLREDVYWYYNGEYTPCTAADFIFAFRRLFNPAVKSENAPLFYCIKNSEKVHKGEIPYLDAVGVESVSDYELVITLEYPNPLFSYLLTTSPAMPCNEELYEKTSGRYGLNDKNIPSNGSFYIKEWSYDPYSKNNNIIIMRRNTKNSESDRTYPFGLNFFIGEDDPLSDFLNGNAHSIIAEGETAEALLNKDYPYNGFENSVWGVAFNTKRAFGNSDLRFAFASAFDRDEININKKGYRAADDIIPPLINLGNEPYRTAAGEAGALEYNPAKAREAFDKGAKSVGYDKLTGLYVIVPDNKTIYEYISRISQRWQADLGFYCSIKTLAEDEFLEALYTGDFDIAMTKLTGEYNSPDAYLSLFGLRMNCSPYPEYEYKNILSEARRASDSARSANLYRQAENILLEQAVFMPVCYQTELFFYNKKCEGLVYNPFTGTINYKQAKYFK